SGHSYFVGGHVIDDTLGSTGQGKILLQITLKVIYLSIITVEGRKIDQYADRFRLRPRREVRRSVRRQASRPVRAQPRAILDFYPDPAKNSLVGALAALLQPLHT